MIYVRIIHLIITFLLLLAGCTEEADKIETRQTGFVCDRGNAGLILPPGFCAGVIADNLGFVRHIAVNHSHDLYVTLRNKRLNLGGLLALRDSNQDGRMDIIARVNRIPGMGIKFKNDALYFASDNTVYRYHFSGDELIPSSPAETVISGLPEQELHAGKAFTFDNNNHIYINIGAPSNACQEKELEKGSHGLDPCSQLDKQSGIWRYKTNEINQNKGYKYASGVRNAYAIDWHDVSNGLYVVQHGRDKLHELWPGIFSEQDEKRLPAEVFFVVKEGFQYSWPYCYFDPQQDKYLLAPEYSGDGSNTDRCKTYADPIIAFPGHFGPNDLVFYTGDQFPVKYRNGAFIAFHGAYTNKHGLKQGHQVVFVPFKNNHFLKKWEVFADGFAGIDPTSEYQEPEHKPTGLAIGPDGSLYVSDSVQGRIWRIIYLADEG